LFFMRKLQSADYYACPAIDFILPYNELTILSGPRYEQQINENCVSNTTDIVVATRVWIETAEAALMATGVHHSGLPGHGVAVDVANTFKKIQYQNVTSDV
jgi:hypothetical protein